MGNHDSPILGSDTFLPGLAGLPQTLGDSAKAGRKVSEPRIGKSWLPIAALLAQVMSQFSHL